MKFKQSLLSLVIFVVLLGCFHYLHVTFFHVNVVFYAAITDAVLASLCTGLIVFFCGFFRNLGKCEKVQLLIIFLLTGYGFSISVPTVIDRSLSLYILEKLQQRRGGIKQSGFEYLFTQEYMKEHRLIDVRLTEQLESGTIIIENGCVKLTKKGKSIAKFSRFYRQHLLPKKRLLMGEYTDDLTDPFRHSDDISDYSCD